MGSGLRRLKTEHLSDGTMAFTLSHDIDGLFITVGKVIKQDANTFTNERLAKDTVKELNDVLDRALSKQSDPSFNEQMEGHHGDKCSCFECMQRRRNKDAAILSFGHANGCICKSCLKN